MSKRKQQRTREAHDAIAEDRRRFVGAMALSAGMATLAAGLGSTRVAAQNGPNPNAGAPGAGPAGAAAGGPPRGPSIPPPPKVPQPPPLKDVAGKTAYITAASDGIGLGIARACSNAGMKVVLGYRNEARLAEALPLFKPGNAGVHAIKHDVTDRDGWTKLVEEIKGKFGNLHLLVNNAGAKTLAQASQAKFDVWDNAVAVNFTAIYNGVMACLPHFREHNEGAHIVCTASMSGVVPGVLAGVYTATKIAAVGLMEALRVELEGTNIGTSAFCPGGVITDNRPPEKRKAPPPGRGPSVMMDPLEAGERVLNGVRNNDLFIFSHPEFKDGMRERFDAFLASVPEETPPPDRARAEQILAHCPVYPLEIEHRKVKRKSYRG
jgi:NAD(P)-dependent dehydrogenase (short-subunit alcohol dehydrogenase family)